MLSREELEAIRAEAESGAYPSEAAEAVLVLLWHIDAMEALRDGARHNLPAGARTLPDGSIRLGPVRHPRKGCTDADG